MSKIHPALPSAETHVSSLDLGERNVGAPRRERPAGGILGFSKGGASEPPMTMIERRRREAERITDEARRQAERTQQQAYHAGFEQGERAGEKLALQKSEPLLQTLTQLIDSVTTNRDALIRRHEQELIKIAFAIATHVVKQEIELAPEIGSQVMESALSKVVKTQRITVRMCGRDLHLIEQKLAETALSHWPPEHVKLEADDSIGRGGCRIETETGDIDATIETQLRVLRELLWEE